MQKVRHFPVLTHSPVVIKMTLQLAFALLEIRQYHNALRSLTVGT
jgi:hypothetical protein